MKISFVLLLYVPLCIYACRKYRMHTKKKPQLTSILKFACFYNPFLSLTSGISWGLWGFFFCESWKAIGLIGTEIIRSCANWFETILLFHFKIVCDFLGQVKLGQAEYIFSFPSFLQTIYPVQWWFGQMRGGITKNLRKFECLQLLLYVF